MAYADFDLKQAVTRFRLLERVVPGMFAGVAPRSPSPRLTTWLDRYGPLAMGLGTERARSEYLITPILAEVEMQAEQPLQVLPGVSLDVDRSQGLTGVCDYLIARSEELFYVRAPLVAVVEAKREDLTSGLGQCVAEMVAVQIFNAREEADVEVVWGSVTSGSTWRFLRLQGDELSIDPAEHHLQDIPRLLGILSHLVEPPRA